MTKNPLQYVDAPYNLLQIRPSYLRFRSSYDVTRQQYGGGKVRMR